MEFKVSCCSENQLEQFIRLNYVQFSDDFKEMSECTHYSHKLYTKSVHYECWEDKEIIGVLCAYLNDIDSIVYIPYLCVNLNYSGHGIASHLIQQLILDVYIKYDYIDLEVRKENISARLFYKKNDFYEISSNIIKIQLRKDLRKNVNKL